MINSTTGRMTTEHWENYSVIWTWYNVGKSGRNLKSVCGMWCTFSMGNYCSHDIIIFPLG